MAKNITNTKSNTLISGTSGNDTLYNGTGHSNRGGNKVTINGGEGNDYIDNWVGSNVSLVGGADNDDISNYKGEKATISGGAGADFIWNGSDSDETSINGGNDDDGIYNYAEEVTITGGKGNDRIYLENDSSETLIKYSSDDGNDTIRGFNSTSTLSVSGSYSTQVSGYDVLVKSGSSTITLKNVYATADKVNINGKTTALKRKTIQITADNNDIRIYRDSISVVGSSSYDYIENYGDKVTINSGKGDDHVSNSDGDNVIINTGAGADYIDNWEDKVTITGGTGNDSIYLGYSAEKNVINYSNGDGNDVIQGFSADSTLQIGGGSYSTKKSGSDIIVTVGKGKITLQGAASLSKLNIKKTSGDSSSSGGDSSSSTTKTVTNSTKSPVTVSSSVKNIISASRTKAVKITGNSLANSIVGGSKNDILYGKAGNDTIRGGKGSDKIYGGAGNDYIYGGDGNDTLKGGKGNDKLWGNDDDNVFIYENGDGKDTIYGFDDDDMLKITGSFSASYNSSKKEIYFKVGNTSNAITLKNYDTSTFNVNGSNYRISGSKLVKR